MLVGLDDTDSLAGGCTTHALFALLEAVPDLALAGPPSLVRLNPNNPRKTRGNGAVAFRLVEPRGPAREVGCWRGQPIQAFAQGAPVAASESLLDALWTAVQEIAEPDAGSGLVAANAASANDYWRAVRSNVEAPPTARALERSRVDGWGLIGARAAVAWPGPPSSFELIAYRDAQRIGTERMVDDAPLAALDAGTTFHSFDATAQRLTCVPHTPCPVLAGLRGRSPDALLQAGLPALRAAMEPFDSWLLWQSNQASGDHVTRLQLLAQSPAGGTVETEALVTGAPMRRAGGHQFVPCQDRSGTPFTAAAFEPTKQFRDVVAALRPGDRVTVVGPYADGVVRLEKLCLLARAAVPIKEANPACPDCGKRMKSVGAGAGFRCRACGTKAASSEADVRDEPRTLALGWHEVPVVARRHLHRPAAWPNVAPQMGARRE